MKKPSAKQGQYLAFIHHYTQLHGQAPAELDIWRFFGTTPPSVHQMIVRLEASGFIERVPGQARSIRLLIPAVELPKLEGSAARDRKASPRSFRPPENWFFKSER